MYILSPRIGNHVFQNDGNGVVAIVISLGLFRSLTGVARGVVGDMTTLHGGGEAGEGFGGAADEGLGCQPMVRWTVDSEIFNTKRRATGPRANFNKRARTQIFIGIRRADFAGCSLTIH